MRELRSVRTMKTTKAISPPQTSTGSSNGLLLVSRRDCRQVNPAENQEEKSADLKYEQTRRDGSSARFDGDAVNQAHGRRSSDDESEEPRDGHLLSP
jgi:hypothetical protein